MKENSREGMMTSQATVYRILIAAPNDVIAEQRAIQEMISSWNTKYSAKMKAVFLPFFLETLMVKEMNDRPQSLLKNQIIKDCDILIGIFWTRIGTDAALAEPITIKAIKDFLKLGKIVMIYLSSAPSVPGSVDLKQYGILMKYMDEFLKQGLVINYDSIDDFRKKLSTQIISNMLKLPKTPEAEIRGVPDETAKKALHDKTSNRFCDLIERHKLNWTSEKNIKPLNLDDGRKIIIDLASEIVNLKETLAKVFSKEIIEQIDLAVYNLSVLKKHRLYFDGKSYNEFWKLGDEIFTSLDAITGELRKDLHMPKIDDNMKKILIELSKIKDKSLEPIQSDVIAKKLGLSITEINFYLKNLLKVGFISHILTTGSPTKYSLRDAGKRFLVEKDIK